MINQFAKLEIDRLIFHEIFQKNEKGDIPRPLLNIDLSTLTTEGIKTFKKRIISTMGRTGKCLEMEVVRKKETDPFQISCKMMYDPDKLFINNSRELATAFADSQTSMNIPGGMIVIFSGTLGANNKKYLGILKADIHEGFNNKKSKEDSLSIEYVDSLFLTPGQKLYKVCMFIEEKKKDNKKNTDRHTSDFEVLIFDNNIVQGDSNSAANYFYSTFLGCKFANNDKQKTKKFYDFTKLYINDLDKSEEEKINLNSALLVYLNSQSQTISVSEFGNEHLPNELRDLYNRYMLSKGLPENNFHKEVGFITRKLKTRKLMFSNNTKIISPVVGFANNIQIIEEKENSTIIEIHGKVKED